MGADNLIKFHRWYKWKSILKICKVAVFDRHGFKKKAIKSVSYKNFYPKSLIFVNFNVQLNNKDWSSFRKWVLTCFSKS